MKANYTKRIAEQTERIRRIAETLPTGQKHALLNACGTIELHSRRQSYFPTPSQQQEAICDRYNSTRQIVSALLAGRTLCFRDAAEFHTSEFHTRIVDARKYIQDKYPEFTFCSEWAQDGRYKQYHLESIANI